MPRLHWMLEDVVRTLGSLKRPFVLLQQLDEVRAFYSVCIIHISEGGIKATLTAAASACLFMPRGRRDRRRKAHAAIALVFPSGILRCNSLER